MTAHSVASPPPLFDEDGLLVNPGDWNEELARAIARDNDIAELTDDHWQVIHALRAHYARQGVAPAMAQVCRRLHHDRHWVHDLFHTCLNAWRVAGLPNPGEEAKTYLSDS
jgi:tRNA 2-thiouridine synthesizing protein E